MSRTLWFCYSFPDGVTVDSAEPRNSPYSLSWHVGRFLRDKAQEQGLNFRFVGLQDDASSVQKDDLCIGHIWHPYGFINSAFEYCEHVFVLQPYTRHFVADTEVGWMNGWLAAAEHIFFITGRTWFDGIPDSPYADYLPKMTRLDMAVNAMAHPYSKHIWNPQGRRAALLVGNDTPAQNWAEAAELARVSGLKIGYCGNALPDIFSSVSQFKHYGGVVFDVQTIETLCKEYDALICLHKESANPTVLLEAAAWGLITYCTPTCGYYPNDPFMELRGGDLAFNWMQMQELQDAPEFMLQARSQATRLVMEAEYHWTKMCDQIWQGIEANL
jgi:hypothetical protein